MKVGMSYKILAHGQRRKVRPGVKPPDVIGMSPCDRCLTCLSLTDSLDYTLFRSVNTSHLGCLVAAQVGLGRGPVAKRESRNVTFAGSRQVVRYVSVVVDGASSFRASTTL